MTIGSEPSRSERRPPNIITVVLDCARAKNFATSGGSDIARTPIIDALAARGTAFSRAVAPANWTVPSHFSIFSGRYPNVHGVRTFQKVPGRPETSATFLRQRGYETALFTENLHLAGGYGLEDGYELLQSRRIGITREQRTKANMITGRTGLFYSAGVRKLLSRLPPLITPISYLFHSEELAYKRDVCGSYTLDWFSQWMAQRKPDRPFHAFFNFVDTHDPYEIVANGHPVRFLDRAYLNAPRFYVLAVPGFQAQIHWEPLVRGYLKSIGEADRKIGRLLGTLEEHGELERTMVVVTSDHGQSFGESGNVFHGCGATDSVTRVPLVVTPPVGTEVPRRVDRWVSLCEIDSWIRAASSGAVPYDAEGRAPPPFRDSLPQYPAVYCEGGPASDQVRSLTGIGMDQPWNHRQLAAYRGDEKYVIDYATSEIFHWVGISDPDRSAPTRLTASEAESVRRSVFGPYEVDEAARVSRASQGPTPEDIQIDQRLRSWGYD